MTNTDITFYDVSKREKVEVPLSEVKKTSYVRETKDGGTQTRYAVKAEFNGSKLTKFVGKEDWDKLDVPVV